MHSAGFGRKPTIIAAGFFALDVVFGLDDTAPRFYAGGTSGNIVAGLSYMGWEALPLARLSDDVAGDFVRKDLKRWGCGYAVPRSLAQGGNSDRVRED